MSNTRVATGHGFRVGVEEVLARIELAAGIRSATAFRHGTLELKLYAPKQQDPQQPHTRDEVYVVVSGNSRFVHGEAVDLVEPGDILFVPAGMAHRFEDFTHDLVLWVIFYGPEGGEQPGKA
ncbi:MAG: cupin domain-containing protein [Proteobacteria bacterium]|nr:cupin domain-containing protein [Pseudomonadota bacterium]MBI3499475.1 cupin domain-containing protein [Pseudomonadota bacterium]